ncbi:16S rRNA (cytosine(1402)-N(4))-methyltransferase RsmH [Pelagibacterium xiamenense]|uniref:16S rRNA (cytosine(1402)-N(4))-methyltransferase RsmH n=1 Tax=Pelagibacterium xiamenense TaxID=2901140 RepID=UPI001E442197|nr:16S rRNA (cytosine(1402)-N(4))-methyltransferase RsmH [Pelagibacterium xiamenense]MCD7060143.1 16S rRNA (cytosine(1402)-N(4))-methyltransferase RsmH [Pelagibacterium xiamenense]
MGELSGTGAGSKSSHESVLLAEVLDALGPLEGARVVDGTFGAGGYSRALLNAGAAVVGIDRDPGVKGFADAVSDDFPERFTFVAGRFAELDALVSGTHIDAVVLDIGVSSMQLDQGQRGFSFQKAGPLDMRMSQDGTTAADLVNELGEKDLANLIFAYGEERASRRIAKAIVDARSEERIEDTLRLAQVIEKTVGRKPGAQHPATRTFQALRIAVNREFDELVEGLFAAERALSEGGRLAVVTFHSLEDRIVKRFFDAQKTAGPQSRHMPVTNQIEARWAPIRKAIKAGVPELARNPRARSATLRSAVRTGAPARPFSREGLGVPGFARGAA